MKRTILALAVVIAFMAMIIPASADVVPPFTSSPGAAVTALPFDPQNPAFSTLVVSTGPVPFSFGTDTHGNPKNIGTFIETVQRVNGTGNLAFLFQVTVTGGLSGDIQRISTGDWDNSINIAAFQYQTGGATIASTGVDRNGLGTVGINFDKPLVTQGTLSWEVMLLTDSNTYISGSIGLIDSGSNPSINGFVAGVASTPEPATLSLLGFGLVGLGTLRKKLRK